MNIWLLLLIAWIGQLLTLHARRHPNAVVTITGAALDIGAVAWLCVQHRWVLAGFTFVVLPIITAAVLGFWIGYQNRFRVE